MVLREYALKMLRDAQVSAYLHALKLDAESLAAVTQSYAQVLDNILASSRAFQPPLHATPRRAASAAATAGNNVSVAHLNPLADMRHAHDSIRRGIPARASSRAKMSLSSHLRQQGHDEGASSASASASASAKPPSSPPAILQIPPLAHIRARASKQMQQQQAGADAHLTAPSPQRRVLATNVPLPSTRAWTEWHLSHHQLVCMQHTTRQHQDICGH